MKTCLVVDDSKVVRTIARRILEEIDFEVAEAAVLAEMRRRLARANARGDSAAASKYSAVIEELEGSR